MTINKRNEAMGLINFRREKSLKEIMKHPLV